MKVIPFSFLFLCFCLFSVASAQIRVLETVSKRDLAQNVEMDSSLTYQLSSQNEPFYYGNQFGKHTLIAYPLPAELGTELEIKKISAPFYGGSLENGNELFGAKIKALLWNDVDSSRYFNIQEATRSSAAIDFDVPAEMIQWVDFIFTDSSKISNSNLWIGFFYESAIDSQHCISPVFSSIPSKSAVVYQRFQEVDSTRTDTIRMSHRDFWKKADEIGEINAYITYQKNQETTRIEPLATGKPSVFQVTAFPNPFNPTVTLKIFAAKSGWAEIQVVNSAGQVVYQKKEYISAGRENLMQWKAANVSSGVYFVRVSQDAEIQNLKLTLLK